ncbi:MAG: ABC transporter permease, partial [Blastocatellia bacterium]
MGFLLAALIGVPAGILISRSAFWRAYIEPVNDFMRYLPVAAFIPLAILWLGIGNSNQIGLIFLGTFFQVIVMVADSVAQVPKEFEEVATTLYGRDRWISLNHIVI